jgi:hypothetical protein
MLVNSVAYALGQRGAWMMNSNSVLVGTGVACLVSCWVINVRGLHVGKIVMNGGAALTVVVGALTMFLLVKRMASGVPPVNKPFSFAVPAFSIATLNVFTKIAMGGLTGFDNASVFAGECRGARRDLPRSVMVAAPLIALIYVLSTGAMLAWIPAGKVDLAAPIPQLLRAGFGSTGIGAAISVATIAVMTMNSYAGAVAMVGLASRFPMVIAWDKLLPEWWSRLHSKYRTPVKSIGAVSVACIAVQFVSSGGAGGQEMIQGHGGGHRGAVHDVLDAVRDRAVCAQGVAGAARSCVEGGWSVLRRQRHRGVTVLAWQTTPRTRLIHGNSAVGRDPRPAADAPVGLPGSTRGPPAAVLSLLQSYASVRCSHVDERTACADAEVLLTGSNFTGCVDRKFGA